MAKRNYQFQSEFAREYIAIGKEEGKSIGMAEGKSIGMAEGKSRAILSVCRSRGLLLTQEQQTQLLSCQNHTLLDTWLERSVTAPTSAEIFRS
ncbi:MAG: hypothetical protein HUU55_08010 [Myxococcales bacterium]|nr:hypothetical protein [Myxococcales bacterium]